MEATNTQDVGRALVTLLRADFLSRTDLKDEGSDIIVEAIDNLLSELNHGMTTPGYISTMIAEYAGMSGSESNMFIHLYTFLDVLDALRNGTRLNNSQRHWTYGVLRNAGVKLVQSTVSLMSPRQHLTWKFQRLQRINARDTFEKLLPVLAGICHEVKENFEDRETLSLASAIDEVVSPYRDILERDLQAA